MGDTLDPAQLRGTGSPIAKPAERCERCNHGTHQRPSPRERLRRAVGMRSHRVVCGESTDLGRCPCLGRFHVR